MKRLNLFFVVLLFILGCAAVAKAEDVVYLNDGSIIHGTIIEEVPGVSIKIQTNDGNIFVYKVKLIAKITHSVPNDSVNPDQSGDNSGTVVTTRPVNLANDFKSDPNAGFSIGAIFIGLGVMDPSVLNQFNTELTALYGSSYDFNPWAYSGDIGVGWYTNHLALKWTGTFAFNWEEQDYYYSTYGYYALDEFLGVYGSELEADLSLDDVQTSKSRPNARRVGSVYLPLMFGAWESDLTTYDSYGDSDTFTGMAYSFGTGIGARFIDENHNMFDFQLIYRWSSADNMKDSYGYVLPLPSGKDMTASVSGLAFNINYGFTF